MDVIGFIAASLVLFYIVFGYPLLLAAIVRFRPRPVRRAPFTPRVSIIVAVHNGAEFVRPKLRSILELDYPRELVEILIACDGCTDRTGDAAAEFEGVRVLRLARTGKAGALNAAIREASGEILVLTDIRQRLAPDSLRLLLENFADPSVGAASAELIISTGNTTEEASVGLYWRYELNIRLLLSGFDSIFGATGAYYALRRELAVPIPGGTLLDDMYLPLAAFFRGYRLIVDNRAHMFDFPTRIKAEFWRKVRTLAGNYQILAAYPALLTPRNRLWFHFLSYKAARLMLPLIFAAIFWFSLGLPQPWMAAAVAGQAGVYAAALLDRWVPEGRLKKLTSAAATLVSLIAAAAVAPVVYFVPGFRIWKTTVVSAGPASPH